MKLFPQFRNQLNQFKPLVYRDTSGRITEVNDDLVEALKAKSTEKEEKTRVIEAKEVAIDALTTFNSRTIRGLEVTDYIENGRMPWNKHIDTLRQRTREDIFDVLRGRRSHGVFYNAEYQRLIRDIEDNSNEAVLTIDNVNRSLITLQTLRKNYQREYETKLGTKSEENKKFFRFWKNFGGNRVPNTSQKFYFETRASFVDEVFSELEEKIAAKKSDVETAQNERMSQIKQEFNDTLSFEQKKKIIEGVEKELDPALTHDIMTDPATTNIAKSLFGGLEKEKRLEMYKLLGWDETDLNKVLETTALDENLDIRTLARDRRDGFDATQSGLRIDTIKTKLEVPGEEITPENDLPGLLKELKPFVDSQGIVNRETLFQHFPNKDQLNPYQEFVAYARFLQTSAGTTLIKSSMPKGLKIKFLSYIAHLEEETSLGKKEVAFSPEFKKFEKDEVKKHFEKAKKLVNNGLGARGKSRGLKDVINLSHVNQTVLDEIGSFVSEHEVFKRKVEGIVNDLPQEEKTLLEAYLNKIDSFVEKIEELQESWESSLQDYKKDKGDLDKLKKVYTHFEAPTPLPTGRTTIKVDGTDYLVPEDPPAETWSTPAAAAGGGALTSHLTNGKAIERAEARIKEFEEAMSQLRTAEVLTKGKLEVDRVKAKDLKNLELDTKQVSDNVAKHAAPPARGGSAKFLHYLKDQSNIVDNKHIEEAMEANRDKQLKILKQKVIGSSIDIEFQEFQHGNPPTSDDMINRTNFRSINDLVIIEKTDTGVILSSPTGRELIFIQQRNERIEVIGMDAPTNNILTEGVPEHYDPGNKYNFVGSPISIVAA